VINQSRSLHPDTRARTRTYTQARTYAEVSFNCELSAIVGKFSVREIYLLFPFIVKYVILKHQP